MKIKGWKQILGFTYLQNVKSKAFKASTALISVIFALICVAFNLLPKLLMDNAAGSSAAEDGECFVETLYVFNETEIPDFDFTVLSRQGINCVAVSADEYEERLEQVTSQSEADVLLHISGGNEQQKEISLTFYRPENEEMLDDSVVEGLASVCGGLFKESLLMSIGVSESDLELAQADIETSVLIYGAEEESVFKTVVNAVVPIITCLILFVFIVCYSQMIAQSVAMEKTSRVVELLITSVRPLAIIMGKVAGMLLVCLTQVLIIGAVSTAAFLISMPFGFVSDLSAAAAQLPSYVSDEAAAGIAGSASAVNIGEEFAEAMPGLFNAGSIIAVIITVILGFLFYALLAGLVGAGVSRSEDLTAAIQPLMFVAMLGFILSYLPAVMNFDGEGNIIMTISRYLPISSPFALPSAILMGQMSGVEIVVSVLILAALTGLTVLLVAKVYENIILYSGNVLKFSQILKMAKKS